MMREPPTAHGGPSLIKAAAVFAVVAALAVMLALWSPAPRCGNKAGKSQNAKFSEFLCCVQIPWVGWAWRRIGARQPAVGRPTVDVPHFFRNESERWRTT